MERSIVVSRLAPFRARASNRRGRAGKEARATRARARGRRRTATISFGMEPSMARSEGARARDGVRGGASARDVGIAMSAPSAFFAFLESASSSLDARAIATRFLGAAARRPPRTAALGARAIVDDDDVEDNAIMVTAAARAVSRGRREARCDWRARCARCASTEGASVGGWTEACWRWRARIGYRRRFHDRLTAFHDSSCGAELSSTSTDRHWTYFRTTYIFETRQTFAHTNSLFDTFSRPGRYYFC